jgi:hypothetical protein
MMPLGLHYRQKVARRRQTIIKLGFWNVSTPRGFYSNGKGDSLTDPVYFARRADGLIKIGRSGTPAKRAHVLRSELLAVIPSVGNFEAFLHFYFEGFREEGEWFWPEPPLLAFIDRVNEVLPQETAA